ncbi:hypothetical protein MRX96_017286 [Rhipicephalus microplus]
MSPHPSTLGSHRLHSLFNWWLGPASLDHLHLWKTRRGAVSGDMRARIRWPWCTVVESHIVKIAGTIHGGNLGNHATTVYSRWRCHLPKKQDATRRRPSTLLGGGCQGLVIAVGGRKRRFREAFVVEQPDDPHYQCADYRLLAAAGFLPSHSSQGLDSTTVTVPPNAT